MQQHLRDGLILRTLSEGVASDRDRLPDFYASINTEGESDRVKEGMRLWTRSLIDGHPTVTPDDVFVVVDPTKDNLLVSATLLIPQVWRYENLRMPVGRPELVATHWEYRGRGLVRSVFEAIHARSDSLGHLVQGITGIPHFYRQFGYTMAVELDDHAYYSLYALPPRPEGTAPAFLLRAATRDDIPTILAYNDYHARGRLLSDAYQPDQIEHEIMGRTRGYYPHTEYLMIVNTDGQPVGYLVLIDSLRDPHELRCLAYVVGPESSYLATFQDAMYGVRDWAQERYGRVPETVMFYPGIHEAVDRLIDRSYAGHLGRREYGWYLRVPDMAAFLRHITPVLEQRLEGTGAHRYTGSLRIGFANLRGLELTFDAGRITGITNITGKDGYDAEFPWHTFLNVVFGWRTADEMIAVLPDVWTNGKASVLLNALFPKKLSWLRGLA